MADSKTMIHPRIFWIDVVKFLAIFMIIHAHVLYIASQDAEDDVTCSMDFLYGNSIVASLGVPLFMMVSGALLFEKHFRTWSDIFTFYRNNLLPLFVTAEIWIAGYCLITQRPFSMQELLLCMALAHKPEVHLWYVRVIVMYYLAVPFLNILRLRYKCIFIFLLLAVTSFTFVYNGWLILTGDACPTSPSRSYFCYIVYMTIGWWIRKVGITRERLILAFSSMMLSGIILFLSLMETDYFLWYDNPLLAVAAISLFYIIKTLPTATVNKNINKWISEISKMSYGIYLSHFLLVYVVGVLMEFCGCNELCIYVSLVVLVIVNAALITMMKRILPRISKIFFRY